MTARRTQDIIHIKGSLDHLVNRGTLCAKDLPYFVARNAGGTTVHRWISAGMTAAAVASSETPYLTWKVARSV